MNEIIDAGGARFVVIVRIQFMDNSSGIAIRSYFEKNNAMFHRLNQIELEQLRSSYELLSITKSMLRLRATRLLY